MRDRLRGQSLLIVDEAHKYIKEGSRSLHVLADLLKETHVPQLWTATGDLLRYLDRKASWSDPFEQIRSRISHRIDLKTAAAPIVTPRDVREIANQKFGLKLNEAASRELCEIAKLDDEGSIRLVENTLKHAKRLAIAGNLTTIDLRIVRQSMDLGLSKRARECARKFEQKAPAMVETSEREATRAIARPFNTDSEDTEKGLRFNQ